MLTQYRIHSHPLQSPSGTSSWLDPASISYGNQAPLMIFPAPHPNTALTPSPAERTVVVVTVPLSFLVSAVPPSMATGPPAATSRHVHPGIFLFRPLRMIALRPLPGSTWSQWHALIQMKELALERERKSVDWFGEGEGGFFVGR